MAFAYSLGKEIGMRFDTKIAVVVLTDLPMWQKLNIVSFCSSGVDRAMGAGLRPAIFTRDLFGTDHDEANRAAVKVKAQPELERVGFVLRGERGAVDKIVKGMKLHE